MYNQINPITIVLADDHQVIREGFTYMVNTFKHVRLLATVTNGEELIKAVTHHLPQIVITDIQMPVMGGIEATKLIKEKFPEIKLIGFSSFNEEYLIKDVMNAGASGYMLKNVSTEDLLKAFDTVLLDEDYFCTETTKTLMKCLDRDISNKRIFVALTDREEQVLKLIAQEKSCAEISEELCISIKTLEKHISNLKQKIAVKNTAGIGVYAAKNGYV